MSDESHSPPGQPDSNEGQRFSQKLERIKKRPDYLAVAASRRKWVTNAFILQYKPKKNQAHPRFGFTVTKKVGNAVVRNKVKRRLKEAARLVAPQYAVKSADFVAIGRQAAYNIPFEKLVKDMQWALEKLSSDADLNNSVKKGPKKPKTPLKEN